MRTSRFSDLGGLPTEPPLDRDLPRQRPPDRDPLDRDPLWKEHGTRDRDPLEGTCDHVASYRDRPPPL